MYFLFFLSLVLLILLIFVAAQFFNLIFRGYAPFVSTHPKIMDKILAELKIKQNDHVFELGCGEAGFLRSIEEKFPKAQYTGIEYSFLPYFITKLQLAVKKSRIKMVKKNIFRTDLSGADMIYCYLSPRSMKKLSTKLKRECQPGTKLVSLCYALPDLQPDKTIEVDDKQIYFYTL